jgi:hypothetical protein
VGVALGASYKTPWPARPVRNVVNRTLVAAPSLLSVRGTVGNGADADVAADNAFLSDLELALERPRSHELRAFDALTPHVREVRKIR